MKVLGRTIRKKRENNYRVTDSVCVCLFVCVCEREREREKVVKYSFYDDKEYPRSVKSLMSVTRPMFGSFECTLLAHVIFNTIDFQYEMKKIKLVYAKIYN